MKINSNLATAGVFAAALAGSAGILWLINRTPDEPDWTQKSAFSKDNSGARPTADVARDIVADFERFPGKTGWSWESAYRDGEVLESEWIRHVPVSGTSEHGTETVERSPMMGGQKNIDVWTFEQANAYDGSQLWTAIRDANDGVDEISTSQVESFLEARSTDGDAATMSVAEQRAFLEEFPSAYGNPTVVDYRVRVSDEG